MKESLSVYETAYSWLHQRQLNCQLTNLIFFNQSLTYLMLYQHKLHWLIFGLWTGG